MIKKLRFPMVAKEYGLAVGQHSFVAAKFFWIGKSDFAGLSAAAQERRLTGVRLLLLGYLICIFIATSALAQTNVLLEASHLESAGHFQQAAGLLKSAIASANISATDRSDLAFELDVLKRIRKDYSLSKDELFNLLKTSITDVTREEMDVWIQRGWFDEREIDGEQRFFGSSVSNLYFRHPEMNTRRIHPKDSAKEEHLRLETVEAITKAAIAEKTPYVLPKHIRATMKVTVSSNAVPPGEIIDAWLPIPRHYAYQDGFKLDWSSTQPVIADENSPIRSIMLAAPAATNQPTKFDIEYEYTIRGVHFDLHPEAIKPYDPADPAVKEFTGEGPHVIFTPEIKALSAKIVGDETNFMLKAKKIYDWLSENLQYSFAVEYSTIPNISEYCRSHGYGDCGQQALLFITLCRYNGIPARWQTGWDLSPEGTDIHDWSEIYLAPYGWMPVDPYMGNHAMRYSTTLTQAQKIEIRDFYFGGLDQYRMIANSDHNQSLTPAKKSFRSDNVDFQRAELEHNGQNIYFDQFKFHLNYTMTDAPALP